MAILLIKNNLVKKVSTGFSWKSLFFGLFYPMARGDMKGTFIQLLLCIITFGLNWLITPFIYNRKFITRLIEKGYQPYNEKAKNYLLTRFRYTSEAQVSGVVKLTCIAILISVGMWSCNVTPGVDGSEFLGKWVISKDSPSYTDAIKGMTLEINKEDIFFTMKVIIDGRDVFSDFAKSSDLGDPVYKSMNKFQLSPDRQFLIPINGMAGFAQTYHADNKTIQNMWGWFKKQ